MQVQDIMTADITTVGRNDDLGMVDDLMGTGHIRHVPVMEYAEIVGIVTQRDVFSARMSSTMGVGEKAQRSLLHTIAVKEVMAHPVTTVGPEAPVREAAAMMLDQGIGCLPVVNNGHLVGLITKTDLLRRLRDSAESSEETPAD